MKALDRASAGVRLENVRKSFGSLDVIHGIDLDIKGGEFIVFVGPSGCGKSTLLRMIAGLEDVSDGEVSIGNRDVTYLDPSDRGIAMVFQSYALYPHMTVLENLGFGLKMAGTPADEVSRRVEAAASILKITHLQDRRPGQLSGGQRQRVAIGRAIVREPDVFLFDEPLSNLDAELRVSMRVEIAKLHRTLGNTMIYVTHDQTEAMTLASRIVILRDGGIEQVGTPREVYEDPDNVFVAGFIGSPRINLIEGKWLADGKAQFGEAIVTPGLAGAVETAGQKVVLGVRAENIQVSDKPGNTLKAVIDFAEYLGGTRYLYCFLQDGQALVVEQRGGHDYSSGQTIYLTFQQDKSFFFDGNGARLR
ncbi:ABC transporter ATP-binding protein [Allorhizobium taibaishanense]|uniref:ABC transporter ATP-binding protein n=1 Tax=Allorhizobium taibaishanense TaxID=887144 RepID=A0A1Q9AA39_9HYPH|nr:sn-glycerol-3-phosphate ABC transporter ATP-binding protein UgpC [Allorhizobium taibaishanense]MBB4010062.1 lactose/L-arabinose transport system ATP-binding protein [Allorhizobium taibaishanense]OLP51740.1 ABC transporter ATP-binding protein [Allorhizobium taibaishanense]